jgi:hypothetical protein
MVHDALSLGAKIFYSGFESLIYDRHGDPCHGTHGGHGGHDHANHHRGSSLEVVYMLIMQMPPVEQIPT